MTQSWQDIVAEKKLRQKATIPAAWTVTLPDDPAGTLDVTAYPDHCGLLSAAEVEITNADVDVLLEKLSSATWSSVAVTTAFYKRAIIAQQLTNCLTEVFIERALARAAEVDEHLAKTGKVIGPLHGLPVSLKDQVCIEGLEATIGYVSWLGKYSKENAVLVDILLGAGAVPFVKTNIPQTLMWPESFNHIFGRTTNPNNRSLTCGGSSGGEGALLALRGSPLGVGSDLGGSVRVPSAFCGSYGLRPSYGRIPYGKAVNSLEGQDSIPSVLGPHSNSLAGIKAFVHAVADGKPWQKDPLAVRKPWNEDEYQLVDHGRGEKLCFGILWDDGVILPHPPVTRGLELTKKALIAAGHIVIDWKPFKHEEIYATVGPIWNAGAEEDYKVTTAPTGEPIITTMDPLADPSTVLSVAFRPQNMALSAYQLWQIQKKKKDLRQEYLDHWEASAVTTGTGRPIDAFIAPPAPYTAPPHGKGTTAAYTMIYNALDYVALTMPVSKVDQAVDVKKPAHNFYGKADEDNYNFYDPATFANAPIAIQLVGRTLEEEAVIAMGEIVDSAVRKLLASSPNESKPVALRSHM